eukprot:3613635-Lingulodinium_polyedra.AAC.1
MRFETPVQHMVPTLEAHVEGLRALRGEQRCVSVVRPSVCPADIEREVAIVHRCQDNMAHRLD